MLIKKLGKHVSYKRAMLGIVAFTVLAVGVKYVHAWLTPVPEAVLSADLTKQYARRFQKLDIREVVNEYDHWNSRWKRVAIRINGDSFRLEENEPGADQCPQTIPFDVQMGKNGIAAFTDVDKTRFTYQEYHDQVSSCLDAVLADVQHADQAIASWKRR